MQAEIELRKLHPAEGDDAIRKTDRYEGLRALVENIRRFGLLVPLLVRPRQDDASQYDVIDGNRRFVALCEIHEDPATVIPCMVMGTDAGAGQALSANVMRQAMNPMDEYDVFSQLVAEGMKTTKIGKLFGIQPKRVSQVLALASLAPEIKERVRNVTLSWETAQALTMIGDHKLQEQLVEQHGNNHWTIRQVLENDSPRLATAIFEKEKYFIEGGNLLRDLFTEETDELEDLCADPAIFWNLQHAAIEEELNKLREQGWKALIENGTVPGMYGRHNWPRRAEIRSKKQRARHSAIYSIEDDGKFEIWNEVMPEPEVVKEAKVEAAEERRDVARVEKEAAAVHIEMTGNRPMSSYLVTALKEARSRQVKLALTGNPRLAGRVLLMLFAMSDHRRCYAPRAADLQWQAKAPTPEQMEGFPMWRSFTREYETTRDRSLGSMWKQLAGATHDELVERLGHIAALLFDAQLPGADSIGRAILASERVHGRAVWLPDATFWQGCGRAFMLQVLEECTNATVAARYKTEKVASLAIRMEKWFTAPGNMTWLNFGGKDEPLPQEVIDKLMNWTPALLELPRDHQPVEEIFNDQFDRLDEVDPLERREPAAANAAEQPRGASPSLG